MPMTLNVGLSKKVGQPDYGSLGASCNVEVELDGSLIREDLEKFHVHVRNAFIACRQAVQDELARHQNGTGDSSNGETHANGSDGNRHSGNGHAGNNVANANGSSQTGPQQSGATPSGNGRSGGRRTNPRRATASQVRAIHAIADRQGFDLVRELRERYGTDQADGLSIADASQLIDELKAAPNGTGGGR